LWGGVHGAWVSTDVALERDIIECCMVKELVLQKLSMSELLASEKADMGM